MRTTIVAASPASLPAAFRAAERLAFARSLIEIFSIFALTVEICLPHASPLADLARLVVREVSPERISNKEAQRDLLVETAPATLDVCSALLEEGVDGQRREE